MIHFRTGMRKPETTKIGIHSFLTWRLAAHLFISFITNDSYQNWWAETKCEKQNFLWVSFWNSACPQKLFEIEVESRTQGSRPRPSVQKKKKIRGQGYWQPFRGQTLSRLRTGVLVAKAKDHGHNAEVIFRKVQAFSRKKNVFKIFSLAFWRSWRRNNIDHDLWSIFNESKNITVLEPRTGYFRGLAGFEAKANDLNFEAKTKDFKLCPRDSTFALKLLNNTPWN